MQPDYELVEFHGVVHRRFTRLASAEGGRIQSGKTTIQFDQSIVEYQGDI